MNEFKKEILRTCLERVSLSPIIIIANEHADRIASALVASRLAVENLSHRTPSEIESAMMIFTKMQNQRYSIFVINETQGRGLDFQSTSAIESQGGVFVIITTLPETYLQYRQFLGRTGRIGNKGEYSIILFDRESKNADGEIYVFKKLEELKNEELLFVSKLMH